MSVPVLSLAQSIGYPAVRAAPGYVDQRADDLVSSVGTV